MGTTLPTSPSHHKHRAYSANRVKSGHSHRQGTDGLPLQPAWREPSPPVPVIYRPLSLIKPPMNLALFDLDNTLLAGDSDVEWPRFLIDQGVLDADFYNRENDRFYADYKAGTLNIFDFLDFQLAPLARHSREQLDAWHKAYLAERITPLMTAEGRRRVQAHQAAGDVVGVITATNRFITAPIVAAFGIEHLIATEPEMDADGHYTGKPAGVPCFQAGKITRLNDWLAARGETLANYPQSWFYSDSRNDIPLMSQVTHPVAVDPDEALRAHAEAQGWPVLSFR